MYHIYTPFETCVYSIYNNNYNDIFRMIAGKYIIMHVKSTQQTPDQKHGIIIIIFSNINYHTLFSILSVSQQTPTMIVVDGIFQIQCVQKQTKNNS